MFNFVAWNIILLSLFQINYMRIYKLKSQLNLVFSFVFFILFRIRHRFCVFFWFYVLFFFFFLGFSFPFSFGVREKYVFFYQKKQYYLGVKTTFYCFILSFF